MGIVGELASTREEQDAKLQDAVRAAVAQDVKAMLVAVAESGLPERLSAWGCRKWGHRLNCEDLPTIIGEAIDDLYTFLSTGQGRSVERPSSWLTKVVQRKVGRLLNNRGAELYLDLDEWDAQSTPQQEESARRDALAILRGLVKELEGPGVRHVMAFIFDAVERGVADITSTEIGEALQMNPATVRSNKQRGITRLRRLLEEKGMTDVVLGLQVVEEADEETWGHEEDEEWAGVELEENIDE